MPSTTTGISVLPGPAPATWFRSPCLWLQGWYTPRAWRAWLRMACVLLGLGLSGTGMAQSPPVPAGTASEAGARFAFVMRTRGEVSATTADGARVRVLREGDRVFVGERVSAGSSSEALLRTEDAGWLAVRPGAAFLAERYLAEGQANDSLSLRLLMGSVRLITGWIGHSNRAGYRVLTPSATIGIRGTDHEPFVMTAELANTLAQTEGTYDKVNRGGTTLDANGNRLDIEPGKVGFARGSRAGTTRSLLTILLPVLLERVPDFFVPGEFDAELDQLSVRSEEEALRQLEQFRRSGGAPTSGGGATTPAPAAAAALAVPPARAVQRGTDTCGANAVARGWLAQFDRAILRRNAAAVLQLFAADAQVQATVRTQDGSTSTLTVDRDAFVQSTVDAVAGLTDYRQRRVTTEGWPETAGSCQRIGVSSMVIEQGRQAGKPYRFEAMETYVLERRGGRWLAVQATTEQR